MHARMAGAACIACTRGLAPHRTPAYRNHVAHAVRRHLGPVEVPHIAVCAEAEQLGQVGVAPRGELHRRVSNARHAHSHLFLVCLEHYAGGTRQRQTLLVEANRRTAQVLELVELDLFDAAREEQTREPKVREWCIYS